MKKFATAYTGNGYGTLRCQLFVQSKDRIEEAIAKGFYLEAITICESVIADRLESRLSFVKQKPVNFGTMGRLVTELAAVESDVQILHLLDLLKKWSKRRNVAMHEMVKVPLGEPLRDWGERNKAARQDAIDGYELVKKIYWRVADLNPRHPDRVFPAPEESLSDKVLEAVRRLHKELADGHFVALTESDIKSRLHRCLESVCDNNHPPLSVNTESPWYDDETGIGPLYIDITVFERDELRVSYEPTHRRKGYRYDARAAAIEIKFCRYEADIPGAADDVAKLRALARNPDLSCFVVAVAREDDLYLKTVQSVAELRPVPGQTIILVILSATNLTNTYRLDL